MMIDVRNAQLPLELSGVIASLLVATFTPGKLRDFYCIRSNPVVIELAIPIRLPVAFALTPAGRYQLTFVQSGPHSAADVRRQITDLAIPTLVMQSCFTFSLTTVDNIDDAIVHEALAPFSVVVVRIPTEQLTHPDDDNIFDYDDIFDSDHDDPVNVKFMVTKLLFTADEERGITAAFQRIFDDHRLVLCKKCNMLYNPVHERACLRVFHKGQRIPFPETGEMEEIDVNSTGDQPWKLYYWTCCGTRHADDCPMDCGKEPNRRHEEDPDGGISLFSCEKKTVGDPEFVPREVSG
jgi:hypothetical protein